MAAKNLDTALRSRHMAQFPMSTFTRLFLERYEEQLSTEQLEAMFTWQENLCALSASEREAMIGKRVQAVANIQEFLAKFAAQIVELQKENLRSVVMSNQAHKHADWMQAQNFFVRHYSFLTVEEKEFLEDWELVLCDVSSRESVALLPGLQRCFQRVDSFPCHFTTLTTAIYHWRNLAQVLEKYEKAVTKRRQGRRDPLEPSERKLSAHRRRVLKYPGVVAWFTGYKMELFYKYVLKYEDGQGVFEWGAGGIMHLHSINFGSCMPRVDPAQEEWRLPTAVYAEHSHSPRVCCCARRVCH